MIDIATSHSPLCNPERGLPTDTLLLQPLIVVWNQDILNYPRNYPKIHGQVTLFENNCARPFFGSDHNPFNFKGGWVRSMPGIWQSCRLQSLNHDVFDGRPAVGEVPLLPTLHEGGGHAARVRVQILPQDVLRGPLHLRGRYAYCLHILCVRASFRAFSLSSASSIVFVHKGAKLLGKKYLLCLPLSVS